MAYIVASKNSNEKFNLVVRNISGRIRVFDYKGDAAERMIQLNEESFEEWFVIELNTVSELNEFCDSNGIEYSINDYEKNN